jgi:hypothetical protein
MRLMVARSRVPVADQRSDQVLFVPEQRSRVRRPVGRRKLMNAATPQHCDGGLVVPLRECGAEVDLARPARTEGRRSWPTRALIPSQW